MWESADPAPIQDRATHRTVPTAVVVIACSCRRLGCRIVDYGQGAPTAAWGRGMMALHDPPARGHSGHPASSSYILKNEKRLDTFPFQVTQTEVL